MQRTHSVSTLLFGLLLIAGGGTARGQTTQAPGSFAAGATSVVIAVDDTSQVFTDQATWGSGFVGWSPMFGSGMPSGPVNGSYLSVHNVMLAYSVGFDHRVYLNQGVFGQGWDGWSPLPVLPVQFSAAACASSSAKNKLYAFATSNEQVNFISANYSSSWGDWSVLPDSFGSARNLAAGPPAAMTLPETDTQWVFVAGPDQDIIFTSLPGGTPSKTWNIVSAGWNPTLDGNAVAAVADSNHIYVFATDAISGQILVTMSATHSPSTPWSPWQEVGMLNSAVAPTAAMLSNGTTMLYVTDKSGNVWLGQGTGTSFFSWQPLAGTF